MFQTLASNEFLEVAYRPDTGLLVGRWLRSISEEELQEGYATLRGAALHHGCQRWLVDARRRVDRRRNGPEWVITRFLPEVQQELGTPLAVAFLVLPNHLQELEAATGAVLASPPNAPFRFARFIEEGAANTWLSLPQPRS
jgi:hypothetical protein